MTVKDIIFCAAGVNAKLPGWITLLDSNSLGQYVSVCFDSFGNMYCAGTVAATANSLYVIKYDSNGVKQWYYYGVTGTNTAVSSIVIGSSYIYVSGYANDGTINTNFIAKFSASNGDYYGVFTIGFPVATVNDFGGILSIGNNETSMAFTIVNNQNSIYNTYFVSLTPNTPGALDAPTIQNQFKNTASVSTSINYFNSNVSVINSNIKYSCGFSREPTIYHIILAKWNSTNTNLTWAKRLSSGSVTNDQAYAICLDTSENIYITGYTNDGNSNNIITTKYNSNGIVQWQKILKSGYADSGSGISIDDSGFIYIVGVSNDGIYNYGIVAKYDSFGNLQWQKRIYSDSSISLNKITIYKEYMYICGSVIIATISKPLAIKLPKDGSLEGSYSLSSIIINYYASYLTSEIGTLVESDYSALLNITSDTKTINSWLSPAFSNTTQSSSSILINL